MKNLTWIHESEAAKKLGIQPATLRRFAKTGKYDVSYTSINGRRYQYDQKGIDKLLLKNAVIMHS